MRHGWLLLLFVLCAPAGSGCTDRCGPCQAADCPEGGCEELVCPDTPCNQDTDCPGSQICLDGDCTTFCVRRHILCTAGQVCVSNYCVEPPACNDDGCPPALFCQDGQCLPQACSTDEDCPSVCDGDYLLHSSCEQGICDPGGMGNCGLDDGICLDGACAPPP